MQSLITRTVRPVRTQLQGRLTTWPAVNLPTLSWPAPLAPGALWSQLEEQLAVVERLVRRAGGDLAPERTAAGGVLHVELPGFTPEDVHVEIVGRTLHVRAETHGRSVTWSWTLPAEIDRDKVRVEMSEGLLVVHLPAGSSYRRELRVGGEDLTATPEPAREAEAGSEVVQVETPPAVDAVHDQLDVEEAAG